MGGDHDQTMTGGVGRGCATLERIYTYIIGFEWFPHPLHSGVVLRHTLIVQNDLRLMRLSTSRTSLLRARPMRTASPGFSTNFWPVDCSWRHLRELRRSHVLPVPAYNELAALFLPRSHMEGFAHPLYTYTDPGTPPLSLPGGLITVVTILNVARILAQRM